MVHLSTVQDVAFQLERLVAGMYIYYRQCYRSLKPAAIFPIEVELGINLEAYSRNTDTDTDTVESLEPKEAKEEVEGQSLTTGQSSTSQSEIDDLLLDLGDDTLPLPLASSNGTLP